MIVWAGLRRGKNKVLRGALDFKGMRKRAWATKYGIEKGKWKKHINKIGRKKRRCH